LINYEPRVVAEGRGPNINIITRGGENTNIDEEIPHQIKIQKVVPENTKYDPIRQKEFFKNAVEYSNKCLVIQHLKLWKLVSN
jgi:hypothetical protein